MDSPDLLTLEATAVELGRSFDTVRRYVRAGLLSTCHNGSPRSVRIKRQDLEQLKHTLSLASRPMSELTNEEIVALYKAGRAKREAGRRRTAFKTGVDAILKGLQS